MANHAQSKETKLYRHFDVNDRLLYVGISLNAIYRLFQHNKRSDWSGSIARVEIETFPTRGDALVAEEQAIQAERPIHNTNHNRDYPLKRKMEKTEVGNEIQAACRRMFVRNVAAALGDKELIASCELIPTP